LLQRGFSRQAYRRQLHGTAPSIETAMAALEVFAIKRDEASVMNGKLSVALPLGKSQDPLCSNAVFMAVVRIEVRIRAS
jgi:hypothetical protein